MSAATMTAAAARVGTRYIVGGVPIGAGLGKSGRGVTPISLPLIRSTTAPHKDPLAKVAMANARLARESSQSQKSAHRPPSGGLPGTGTL